MSYWLMKTEPETFSFQDLERDGKTTWDGVRNHQAKKNLATMALGDSVLIYHSVSDKALVGLAEVIKTGYPDPTDPTKQWVAVDVRPIRALKQPITLAEIKANPQFADLPLVRQGRLSVMPLTEKEFKQLLALEGKQREGAAHV